MKHLNRRRLKKEVLAILALNDLAAIQCSLAVFQPSDIVNPLFSALCSLSESVRWNAIMAFGWVVPAIADENMESARIIMRRFLWSLNDESGGIGWGAPEAMGEIMARDERLMDEYLHMLLSYMREDGPELYQDGNYLELPMLQRGLLWGVGRLCLARRQRMQGVGVATDLKFYLSSSDPVVRGLAVWCLTELTDVSARHEVMQMRGDNSEVPIYLNDQLLTFTVSTLATRYLECCAVE